MLIDAAQLCLNQDDFLRTALPFVCCFVSVLYRHHGLDLSNTRYSKCMNLFPTTSIFHDGPVSLLGADQGLLSTIRPANVFLWCLVCVPCSWAAARSFGHHILWKREKCRSAVSIFRAECTILKDTLESFLSVWSSNKEEVVLS